MTIRDAIQKNPAMTAGVCLILIAGAITVTVSSGSSTSSTPADSAWFYDVASGELLVLDRDSVPPVQVNGSTAVRARVYGCSGCSEGDRHVLIIEKFPDSAAQQLRVALPENANERQINAFEVRRDQLISQSLLIAAPPESVGGEVEWILHTDERAQTVRSRINELCKGTRAELCGP